MSDADLSQLTAIVSTADHPKSLQRLVRSLRSQYPRLKVLIADSSELPRRLRGVDRVTLPPGVGHCTGWNTLLARLRTSYFLLLDERCQLLRDSNIDHLLRLVAGDRLDIAAGDLVGCRRKFWFFVRRCPQPGHGLLELTDQELVLRPGHRSVGKGFSWCDFVHNFFVARTDKVRSLGGWDPELGNAGRDEFFVRGHRHGLRVGIASKVMASLWDEPVEAGSADRQDDRRSLAVAKLGLVRLTDLEGREIQAARRSAAA